MIAVRFLGDHDLNEHIVEGVHRREPAIEFLRVRDLGMQTRPDAEILDFACREQWILVSHDVNTMTAEATRRFEKSLNLPGSIMIPQSIAVG